MIPRRVGVLREEAVYRRKSVRDSLQRIVLAGRRRALHVNLVVHGRRICRPVAPRCPQSGLRKICSTALREDREKAKGG